VALVQIGPKHLLQQKGGTIKHLGYPEHNASDLLSISDLESKLAVALEKPPAAPPPSPRFLEVVKEVPGETVYVDRIVYVDKPIYVSVPGETIVVDKIVDRVVTETVFVDKFVELPAKEIVVTKYIEAEPKIIERPVEIEVVKWVEKPKLIYLIPKWMWLVLGTETVLMSYFIFLSRGWFL